MPSYPTRVLLASLCAALLAACQESTQSLLTGPAVSHDQVAQLGGSVDFVASSNQGVNAKRSALSSLGIKKGDDLPVAKSDIGLALGELGVDFVVGGVGGTRNVGSGNVTISGISGTVTKATLYWHGPTNTTNTNVAVRVDGQEVMERSLGLSSDNCWGFANSQAWAADVTSIVRAKGNGTYAISNLLSPGVNSNGASMVVYFDDGNPSNNRDVVVFEGNDSNIQNSYDANGWNVTLAGINYTSGTANMQLHVADGQAFPDGAITINNQPFLAAGPIFDGNTLPGPSPYGNGNLFDIRSFNVTNYLTPGSNTLSLRSTAYADCLALVVALVDLPAGAAPVDVPVDNQPPVARAGADQTLNLNGSHTTTAQLDGSASTDDGHNQPLSYTWSENGNTVATGAQAAVTLGIGTHDLTLTVNDGQYSATDHVVITVVDPTPPSIQPNVTGTLGANGWYTSNVAVSFTVTDLESDATSTGCNAATVSSDTNGQSFTCSATSAGGSSSNTVTVKRDATVPQVGFSGNSGAYTVDQHITITCAASDATSGIASSTCPELDVDAYTLTLGAHTLNASATDNAGNANTAQASFTVSVTTASLCTLVRRWVTQNGVANSLCQKLDAAAAAQARGQLNAKSNVLEAFVNEVQAQRDKAVTSAHADVLITLVRAL